MSHPILCKDCRAVLGTSSKEGLFEQCGECYQAEELERALTQGKNANHELLSDEKIKQIVARVKDKIPKNVSFGERINKHVHPAPRE